MPPFGFYRIRYLIATIVASVYAGIPYSSHLNEKQKEYKDLAVFTVSDWETLGDHIEEAKNLCCRNDCRELKKDNEDDSAASFSGNKEFTTDYENILQCVEFQELVAPIRLVLDSKTRPIDDKVEAISNYL